MVVLGLSGIEELIRIAMCVKSASHHCAADFFGFTLAITTLCTHDYILTGFSFSVSIVTFYHATTYL